MNNQRKLLISFFGLIALLAGCKEVEHTIDSGTLWVASESEWKGGGDDIILGAVYFTSNFGVPGSADVEFIPLGNVADDVGEGNIVSEAQLQGLNFNWTRFNRTGAPEEKSYSQTDAQLSSAQYGFSFEGVIYIAFEEDRRGDDDIARVARGYRDRVERALEVFIEDDSYQSLQDDNLARRNHVLEKLECFQTAVIDGESCGGFGFSDVSYNRIGGRWHDFIGVAQLYFIGTENRLMIRQIRDLFTATRWYSSGEQHEGPSNCGGLSAADVHVCEFVDDFDRPVENEINLLFRGDEGRWIWNLNNATSVVE